MAVVQFASWNADRLTRRLPRRILEEYGPTISFQLQQEISKEQFEWPVPTYRQKRRQFVPKGKRDIIDSGDLLKSQTEPVIQGSDRGSQLEIKWTAPYSGEVLRGGYLVGTVRNNYVAPSRDWITPALKAQNFGQFFGSRWGQL